MEYGCLTFKGGGAFLQNFRYFHAQPWPRRPLLVLHVDKKDNSEGDQDLIIRSPNFAWDASLSFLQIEAFYWACDYTIEHDAWVNSYFWKVGITKQRQIDSHQEERAGSLNENIGRE